MSEIMTAIIDLTIGEADFALDALQAAADAYAKTGAPAMAKPYKDIIAQINQTKKYGDGDSALVSLTGGYIDGMAYAVRTAAAKNAEHGKAILSKLENGTRPLGSGEYE